MKPDAGSIYTIRVIWVLPYLKLETVDLFQFSLSSFIRFSLFLLHLSICSWRHLQYQDRKLRQMQSVLQEGSITIDLITTTSR
ncbi:hypothetical protein HanRHA438_Chr15g0703831 [Helianthus annuus]|nr:hypothetical protein HanHA300_Chr15g0563361 [Helianthus annuus]KAJ0472929.1 hypothetical protein HanHA89_Chr15g0612591 [Helianthus annuus]KAJ0564430.1 hypothetical protein HanHA89_Chr07g0274201 [Helianthus annuus]KAJ0648535.1 hypothetical protein HanLR1_Chr15g0574001 [Helianthus annuus]KAJ0652365.1 hypothetical protein HanOQP8_Chr15g0571341 [Helianthus annuus]